jgi:hypothetical protein
MKLGKLVAKGIAQDVLDVTVEEARSATEPDTAPADTALQSSAPPSTARASAAEPVTAGSSTQR